MALFRYLPTITDVFKHLPAFPGKERLAELLLRRDQQLEDFVNSLEGESTPALAYKAHCPAANSTYTTTSTSFVDLDATNLVVTFTAPDSGSVLVWLSAATMSARQQSVDWNLRDSAGDVAGTDGSAMTNDRAVRTQLSIAVNGLTPGQSYTWKWGWKTSAGTASLLVGSGSPPNGPATMVVWGV